MLNIGLVRKFLLSISVRFYGKTRTNVLVDLIVNQIVLNYKPIIKPVSISWF